jgi:enoyl-CoA hydratase
MTDPHIDLKIDARGSGAHIAYITIANERKLNTLTSALMDQFAGAIKGLGDDAALRAIVVTGAGTKAFIGGADINEMSQLDAVSGREMITRLHHCCEALRNLPVPVIARINGYALGAGLEIAAACDLRIASDTAHFGMPEVRVGIPSVIEAALLPSLIGWGRARQLLLLGETITATEAIAWGLVEKVVMALSLDEAVERWITSILAAGPEAIRLQKKLLRRWEDLPMREAIAAGIDAFAAAWETDEPRRMMQAFVTRRSKETTAR